MELGKYLTATQFNELGNKFDTIVTRLQEKLYPISPELWTKIECNYPPQEMKNLFNNNQKLLYNIDNKVDWINPYTDSNNKWIYSGSLYHGVKRWFDWVNFNFKVVNNEQQKPNYLYTSSLFEIYDVIDENKARVLIYTGYFDDTKKEVANGTTSI